MAKIQLAVTLKNNAGAPIGGGTITKEAATHSAAAALVTAEVDARVAASTQANQDLLDAQAAFAS